MLEARVRLVFSIQDGLPYIVLNMKTGMEKSEESRTRRDEQRRKYSKMEKRAKDKLVRSPRENGGG
jgi:hypothetical protein